MFGWFKRKKKNSEISSKTSDRIIFDQIDEAKDTRLTKLATEVINGNPIVINLELLDVDSANKVIAFLSGVIYAIEGEIHNMQEHSFLFGNSEVYDDGSIKEMLKEYF